MKLTAAFGACIVPAAPDRLWGTDATMAYTQEGGWVWARATIPSGSLGVMATGHRGRPTRGGAGGRGMIHEAEKAFTKPGLVQKEPTGSSQACEVRRPRVQSVPDYRVVRRR
jgi:hypothetical protein